MLSCRRHVQLVLAGQHIGSSEHKQHKREAGLRGPHRKLDEIRHQRCENHTGEAAQDGVVNLKARRPPYLGIDGEEHDGSAEGNDGHTPGRHTVFVMWVAVAPQLLHDVLP